MDVVTQGLQFSLIGLVSIFLFMILFWGIMALLPRMFPDKTEQVIIEDTVGQAEVIQEGSEDEEIAAAIAAAVAYIRATGQSELGKRLEEGRGSWWTGKQLAARQNSVGEKAR